VSGDLFKSDSGVCGILHMPLLTLKLERGGVKGETGENFVGRRTTKRRR